MRTVLVLAALGQSGCAALFGCDDVVRCYTTPAMAELGRVPTASLEGATVQVCVEDACAASLIVPSPETEDWTIKPGLDATIWGGPLEDPATAVVRFEVIRSLDDVEAPPSSVTITITVISAEQETLLAGTWLLQSETREGTNSCESDCRLRVFYRTQP